MTSAAMLTTDVPAVTGVKTPGAEREPLSRQRRILTFAAYAGAVSACLLILTIVLKLWDADLRVPFVYCGDGFLFQALAKGAVEQGWYLHNSRLGAPFGLELHDFPFVDSLHFLGIKLLAIKARNYAVAYNLYFLLTFPLTTLTSLYVLRRFHVSYGPAIVGSLLFTFLPYHFFRGEGHLFLAAYYLLPLIVRVTVQIGLGRTPFLRPDPDTGQMRWSWRDGRSLATVAICLLVACGGVYYAFFSCYFLLAAGVLAWLTRGRRYPLAAAGLAIAVIALGVLANLSPTFVYRWQHGANTAAVLRHPCQAEEYGLKICQLLFPMRYHRLPPFREFEKYYSGPYTPLINENHMAALGMIGALGFLLLAGRLLFRKPAFARGPLLDVLAMLSMAAVLLATIGGFGSMFGYLVSGWIRAYNRISVFIGFFSLFAVVLLLDAAIRRYAQSARSRLLTYGSLAVVLLAGVLDQTSPALVPPYAGQKAVFDLDAAYVQAIEATVPAHTLVFQLPYLGFPESVAPGAMQDYDPLRGFLHSRTLRWSYGALKGREGDLWLQELATRPIEQLVDTLVYAGFGGISVDLHGYADRGYDVCTRLVRLLGPPSQVRADKRLAFFNLSSNAERLRTSHTEIEWQALSEEALHPLLFGWFSGFYDGEGTREHPLRWCSSAGELHVFNRTGHARRIHLEMAIRTTNPEPAELRMESDLFSERLTVNCQAQTFARDVIIPPGKHVVQFRCDARKMNAPWEGRSLVFRVEDFKVTQAE